MKRTPLSRKAPIARGRTRVKPRNGKRKARAYARNFGDEADAVRAMPCLVFQTLARVVDFGQRFRVACEQDLAGGSDCRGPEQAAHVVPRGMGGANGGRFDLVPLCAHHHAEAGEQRTEARATFERVYGLDLRAEADRVAVAHVYGLGVRGLAQRWAAEVGGTMVDFSTALDTYELDALLGWVRRWADQACVNFMRGYNAAIADGARPEPGADGRREAVALARGTIWAALDIEPDDGRALLDVAGWPS